MLASCFFLFSFFFFFLSSGIPLPRLTVTGRRAGSHRWLFETTPDKFLISSLHRRVSGSVFIKALPRGPRRDPSRDEKMGPSRVLQFARRDLPPRGGLHAEFLSAINFARFYKAAITAIPHSIPRVTPRARHTRSLRYTPSLNSRFPRHIHLRIFEKCSGISRACHTMRQFPVTMPRITPARSRRVAWKLNSSANMISRGYPPLVHNFNVNMTPARLIQPASRYSRSAELRRGLNARIITNIKDDGACEWWNNWLRCEVAVSNIVCTAI